MSSIIVTDSSNQRRSIDFRPGFTLMEVLTDESYPEIAAICGGSCSCATCHLHIVSSPEPLPPMEEDEAALLELADGFDQRLSRLSCQIELGEQHDGLEVRLIDSA